MKRAWRGRPWRLSGLGLLMAIGLGIALLAEGGEPALTTYTISGAGTIRADCIWEQGERLC
jgi:hypothetical protein